MGKILLADGCVLVCVMEIAFFFLVFFFPLSVFMIIEGLFGCQAGIVMGLGSSSI